MTLSLKADLKIGELLAIGLSLCFGLMRIISLDQLLYYSIGAYITYTIHVATGYTWLGVFGGMIAAGLISFGVERFVFLRIYERDIAFTMITSFGILFAGVGAIKYVWGLVPRPVPSPIEAQVTILGTGIPVYRLIVIGISLLVYLGIWLFLNRTITGKAIRAGIENVEHVEGLGINVYKLFTTTFIVAGTLSGLAGGVHAPITIDPVTRLEGHLKINVEVEADSVINAWATGTLFRGFETILVNRPPEDAQHITQRICGVCPVPHGLAAVMALDRAYRVTPPANARIMRNLVLGANFIQSHILHFYHLSLPDFIDGPNMPPWQPSWGTDKRFTSAETASLVEHYVTALEMTRKAHETGALFGGRMPHPPTYVAGGFTTTPRAEQH